ncbi:hypothetical protein [Jeotgalibacillus aurantiacus]|uniref:hypothetical protein n=1 Tax=Jeotgalibacillus aurantiacus TaxID=2763266 RepID=UPI001D0ADC6A|nr:hypothetical protein [Jeotgalibacillus aurantiacus]
MFDPTAFDNLKTVLEGTVYDRDLDETVKISHRSDTIDIATLCREFTITFSSVPHTYEADMKLYADLKKLAAELLPDQLVDQKAGALVSIIFRKDGEYWTEAEKEILSTQWGRERCYELRTVTSTKNSPYCEAVVKFDRTITEDMLRDIEDMVYFVIKTIDLLDETEDDNGE